MTVNELIVKLEKYVIDKDKEVAINYDIEEDYYIKEIEEDEILVYLKN